MVSNSGLDCEKEQREWLETMLATNSGKRIFVFSHYSLYLSEADEDVNFDNTYLFSLGRQEVSVIRLCLFPTVLKEDNHYGSILR